MLPNLLTKDKFLIGRREAIRVLFYISCGGGISMVDFKKRKIVLCNSKLKINRNTKIKHLKEKIPDLIVRVNDVKTGYVWYECWVDIDEGDFIKAYLCFYKNRPLRLIELCPQAKKENGWGEEGIEKDPYKETPAVKKWLMDHGMSEGEIEENKTKMFFEGSWYRRACVRFKYRRV